MTKEEAISAFKEWIERDEKMEYADRLENIEIYNMAIKALKQEPCPYWDYGLNTCRHANIGALAIVTPNDVLEKIKAEIEERRDKATDAEYWGLMDALRIIDKYKADKKPTCGDCKEWGTVNCPETYREPTKNDDICDSFKADKGVEE